MERRTKGTGVPLPPLFRLARRTPATEEEGVVRRRLTNHWVVDPELARANGVPTAGNPVVFCLCINDVTRTRWTVVADLVAFNEARERGAGAITESDFDGASADEVGSRAYGGIVANSPWISFPFERKGWPADWLEATASA